MPTRFQLLKEQYLQGLDFQPKPAHHFPIFKNPWHLGFLQEHIDKVGELYGHRGWRTRTGELARYKGFSITYNPKMVTEDINFCTLGTERNELEKFFYSQIENHEDTLNSYYDTYGFNQLTPAADFGYMQKVLRCFKRNIIRSRVMAIDGSYYTPEIIQAYKEAPVGRADFGWHRDEPIYENLRINIPVSGTRQFVFEMEDGEPYVLQPGLLYSWDTNIAHRVYAIEPTDAVRWNIVIGVSPWFDYNPLTDTWIPNEFCNKKDPFQMLTDGDIIDWDKAYED